MRNKSSGELSFQCLPLLLASLCHQSPPASASSTPSLPCLPTTAGDGQLGVPFLFSPLRPALLTALASSLFGGAAGEEVQL